MRSFRLATPIIALALTALVAGAADADRKATPSERKAIAKVVQLPKACTKARISTVTTEPKWASAYWKPHPANKCSEYASDGVAILRYAREKWRFVTAGSSFRCQDLYDDVPRKVADDLGVDCF